MRPNLERYSPPIFTSHLAGNEGLQDLLRFILALAVVVFHYKHFAIQTALSLPPADFAPPFEHFLLPIYKYGYHAVAVFFYLSGYMLATQLSQYTSDNHKFDYRKFIVKRIARIYPAHIVTLFVMGLLALITTSANLQPFITYNDDLLNFIASIFFLNGVGLTRDTSFNLPSWSLSVEFICYLLFAAICLLATKRRSIFFFLGFLTGALITEISSDPNTDNLGSGIIFFFCGALGSIIVKPWIAGIFRQSIGYTSAVLAVGFISFYLSLSTNLGAQKLIWLFVTLPALIIGLDQIDKYLNQGRYRRLQWLGLVSFSIYIWHFPIQAVLHNLIAHQWISFTEPAYNSTKLFWSYIITTIVMAHISLTTVEKWGSHFIKRILKRS